MPYLFVWGWWVKDVPSSRLLLLYALSWLMVNVPSRDWKYMCVVPRPSLHFNCSILDKPLRLDANLYAFLWLFTFAFSRGLFFCVFLWWTIFEFWSLYSAFTPPNHNDSHGSLPKFSFTISWPLSQRFYLESSCFYIAFSPSSSVHFFFTSSLLSFYPNPYPIYYIVVSCIDFHFT